MSWSAPPTFVSGAVLTAAQMNILGGDIAFLGAATGNSVLTNETSASTSYTDLTTPGPVITMTTGANALIAVGAAAGNATAATVTSMSFAVSGATVAAAIDANAYAVPSSGAQNIAASKLTIVNGLTAGSNTFTSKYKASAGTGSWLNRYIVGFPLP